MNIGTRGSSPSGLCGFSTTIPSHRAPYGRFTLIAIIEVVTYCAAGVFRHADRSGAGGILRKGWVQHTTVGRGMWHSEINDQPDEPLRFVQMWFMPARKGLEPSVEQLRVEEEQRTGRLLPDGAVTEHLIEPDRGIYLYVLDGAPILAGNGEVPVLGALMARGIGSLRLEAFRGDAEILLLDLGME